MTTKTKSVSGKTNNSRVLTVEQVKQRVKSSKPVKPTPPKYRSKAERILSPGVKRDFGRQNLSAVHLDGLYDRCDFKSANLNYTRVSNASFWGCPMNGMTANYAWFQSSTFDQCDFTDARFYRAVFVQCDFENMVLTQELLVAAIFISCNFSKNCTLPDKLPVKLRQLPQGQFMAYKKVYATDPKTHFETGYVLELLIPKSAQRVMALQAQNSRSDDAGKSRASKAKVKRVFNQDLVDITNDPSTPKEFHSGYDEAFIYRVGAWVTPRFYDPNPLSICSSGLHFFLQPEDAAAYS